MYKRQLCTSVYILSAVVILVLVGGFLIIQYKADTFHRWFSRLLTKSAELEVDGSYTIVKEDYTPENPIEESILNEIRSRFGVVNLDDYAKKTKFSKLLLKATIQELIDKGVIRK